MNSCGRILFLGALLGQLQGCAKLDHGTCVQAVADHGENGTVQLCDVNTTKFSCLDRPEPGEFHDIDTKAGMQLCESRGFEVMLSPGQELEKMVENGELVTYSRSTPGKGQR